MLRRVPKMLFELLGKLKGRIEAEDVGDFLHGACRICQEIPRLLEPHLAVVLFWAEPDALVNLCRRCE